MADILKARITPTGRRPAAVTDRGRICLQPGCVTRLSMYNRGKACHAHAPTRYPRVRGSVAPA